MCESVGDIVWVEIDSTGGVFDEGDFEAFLESIEGGEFDAVVCG